MNQHNNISKLIYKIISKNRIKSNDYKELENFVDDFDKNIEIEEWLQENWIKAQREEMNDDPISFDKLQDRIKLKDSDNLNARKRFVVFGSKIAASITLLTLVGGLVFYRSYVNKNLLAINNVNNKDVSGNKELKKVVLERGARSFNLSERKISIKTRGVEVVGSESNLTLLTKELKDNTEIIQQWSTLKIPKGKDYYVILSDSTQVWMNACSELTFPDRFMDGKREVVLKGEAYFIVKSDVENPFFVKTLYSTVRVTGTRFNVCSYSDDKASYITLAKGKVNVEFNGESHKIKPGEQFVQYESGKSYIKNVDPEVFISWKEGRFEFSDMTLGNIALRLEKWYRVEFDFKDAQAAKHRFTGMIKKESTIPYFVQLLQKTTDLSFTLQGSKIVVSTKVIEIIN